MLIKGSELTERQKKQVLSAFIYRWTIENRQANDVYKNIQPPTIEKTTDEQWLRDHAFHFLKDGSRLMLNRPHCEPVYIAD